MKKTDPRPATSHIAPFGLRMQPDLKELLEDAARINGRSLNAEIIARLEASFDGETGLTSADKEFLLSLVDLVQKTRNEIAHGLDVQPTNADAPAPPKRVRRTPPKKS